VLVVLCAGAAVFTCVIEAASAGALIVAGSSPGILVTLYEILRVLDDQADDATRRDCAIALGLLLIPLAALIVVVARLGEGWPWSLAP
jgi:hypothetical protein